MKTFEVMAKLLKIGSFKSLLLFLFLNIVWIEGGTNLTSYTQLTGATMGSTWTDQGTFTTACYGNATQTFNGTQCLNDGSGQSVYFNITNLYYNVSTGKFSGSFTTTLCPGAVYVNGSVYRYIYGKNSNGTSIAAAAQPKISCGTVTLNASQCLNPPCNISLLTPVGYSRYGGMILSADDQGILATQTPSVCTTYSSNYTDYLCPPGTDINMCTLLIQQLCTSPVDYTTLMDTCGAHASPYHIHLDPACWYNTTAGSHSPLVGIMLDGYGLYGLYESGPSTKPTTLDACNGHTGTVLGESVFGLANGNTSGTNLTIPANSVYHYHTTTIAPYTIGCFGSPTVSTTQSNCSALYVGCAAAGTSYSVLGGCYANYKVQCPCFQDFVSAGVANGSLTNQFSNVTCPGPCLLTAVGYNCTGSANTTFAGTCSAVQCLSGYYGAPTVPYCTTQNGTWSFSGISCSLCTMINQCNVTVSCTNPSNSQCTTCNSGFFVNNSGNATICTANICGSPAGVNCTGNATVASFTVNGSCTSAVCQQAYFGSPVTPSCSTTGGTWSFAPGTNCTACAAVSQCNTTAALVSCTNLTNSQCTVCNTGYYSNNAGLATVCTLCTPVLYCNVSLTCTTAANSKCTACNATSLYVNNNATASVCSECSTNCSAGTGINGTGGSACTTVSNAVCTACPSYLVNTGFSLSCTSCTGATYPNTTVCANCSSNCLNCTSAAVCQNCSAGFAVIPNNYSCYNTTCTSTNGCISLPSCPAVVVQPVCTLCATGRYLLTNFSAVYCPLLPTVTSNISSTTTGLYLVATNAITFQANIVNQASSEGIIDPLVTSWILQIYGGTANTLNSTFAGVSFPTPGIQVSFAANYFTAGVNATLQLVVMNSNGTTLLTIPTYTIVIDAPVNVSLYAVNPTVSTAVSVTGAIGVNVIGPQLAASLYTYYFVYNTSYYNASYNTVQSTALSYSGNQSITTFLNVNSSTVLIPCVTISNGISGARASLCSNTTFTVTAVAGINANNQTYCVSYFNSTFIAAQATYATNPDTGLSQVANLITLLSACNLPTATQSTMLSQITAAFPVSNSSNVSSSTLNLQASILQNSISSISSTAAASTNSTANTAVVATLSVSLATLGTTMFSSGQASTATVASAGSSLDSLLSVMSTVSTNGPTATTSNSLLSFISNLGLASGSLSTTTTNGNATVVSGSSFTITSSKVQLIPASSNTIGDLTLPAGFTISASGVDSSTVLSISVTTVQAQLIRDASGNTATYTGSGSGSFTLSGGLKVIDVGASNQIVPVSNLAIPFQVSFTRTDGGTGTPICLFYNTTSSSYSTAGMTLVSYTSATVTCSSTHATAFGLSVQSSSSSTTSVSSTTSTYAYATVIVVIVTFVSYLCVWLYLALNQDSAEGIASDRQTYKTEQQVAKQTSFGGRLLREFRIRHSLIVAFFRPAGHPFSMVALSTKMVAICICFFFVLSELSLGIQSAWQAIVAGAIAVLTGVLFDLFYEHPKVDGSNRLGVGAREINPSGEPSPSLCSLLTESSSRCKIFYIVVFCGVSVEAAFCLVQGVTFTTDQATQWAIQSAICLGWVVFVFEPLKVLLWLGVSVARGKTTGQNKVSSGAVTPSKDIKNEKGIPTILSGEPSQFDTEIVEMRVTSQV